MILMFKVIHYCWCISMATLFKKTGVELELLTDVDMLLMVEEGIRGGICHATHRYTKANNMIKWKIIIKAKNHHILNI